VVQSRDHRLAQAIDFTQGASLYHRRHCQTSPFLKKEPNFKKKAVIIWKYPEFRIIVSDVQLTEKTESPIRYRHICDQWSKKETGSPSIKQIIQAYNKVGTQIVLVGRVSLDGRQMEIVPSQLGEFIQAVADRQQAFLWRKSRDFQLGISLFW
jgi:hypothetical protein